MNKPAAKRAVLVVTDEQLSAAAGGRAALSDLTVVKRVDVASAKLFQACATGSHFPEVKI